MRLGIGWIGLSAPVFAFGASSQEGWGQSHLLFLACLLLILSLSAAGVVLLLAHRRRRKPRPFQSLWMELGWGLVPVVLLWALLLPAAVEVVSPS